MKESAITLIVIFDTNVILPLLVGSTRRAKGLRQAWQKKQFELFITPQTLVEVRRVLTYPQVQRNYGLTLAEIDTLLDILTARARLLPGLYMEATAVQIDLSDNVFLAACLEAGQITWSAKMPIYSILNIITGHKLSRCPSSLNC